MALEPWNVDLLSKTSISEAGLPETDAEWRTWEEAQRALGKHVGENAEGHSEYDPEVWMMGSHAPSHEKYYSPELSPIHADDDYSTADWDSYDEDEEEPEGDDYHIVTRPRGAIHGLSAFTEHPYHAFGTAYMGTPNSAMDMFAEDHPEYDTERYPESATHEIIGAHSPEHHDAWRDDLASEDRQFERIAPRGLVRESPEIPGHRAYRHEEPNGVVHRLWYSPYSHNGPGWHTSRYDPSLSSERQPVPWTEHPDNASRDSLGDALAQFEQNRRMR